MEVDAIQDDKARKLAKLEFDAKVQLDEAKNSKASADLKKKWEAAINDSLKVEKIRLEEEYTKKKTEESAKQLEAVRKTAEKELELKKQQALLETRLQVLSGELSPAAAKNLELDIEQTFLEAKRLLNEKHFADLAALYEGNKEKQNQIEQDRKQSQFDTDQEILNNKTQAAEKESELTEKRAEKEKRAEARLRDAREQMLERTFAVMQTNWTQTLAGYKSFFKSATLLQKAGFVAEKAWAIAQIAVRLRKEIANINAVAGAINAVSMGFGGEAYRWPQIGLAVGRAAINTAQVLAVSPNVPTFADGGFTGLMTTDRQPTGFTSGPTYFKSRNFIAGEAGREFIISNPALQNPVIADFARILDSLQQSGNYSNLSYANMQAAGTGGSNLTVSVDQAAILAELRALRKDMQQQSSKPVNFNYRVFERYQDYIDETKQTTSF